MFDKRKNLVPETPYNKPDPELFVERDAKVASPSASSLEPVVSHLKSLLQRTLPVLVKDAQAGSHDSELLQQEVETALK